ncbi:MAG: helix-turn-helix domain-containing protein [Prevotella sp.]|nr:helix-turn-helix domain-containing protein [Prevotella sp.]
MTSQEAADYLGIKRSYLYKMTMRRAIPYYKPGGKIIFFSKEDLDQWLTSVRVSSQNEIEAQAMKYLTNTPMKQ